MVEYSPLSNSLLEISDNIDQDEFAASCTEQLSPVLEGLTQATEVFVRLAFSLGHPIDCLQKEKSFPKSYFKAGDGSRLFAAAGALRVFSSENAKIDSPETLQEAEQYINSHPQRDQLRLFGGVSFSGLREREHVVSSEKAEWQGFPAVYFFLPEIVFEESIEGKAITVGVKAKPGDSLAKIIGRIQRRLLKFQAVALSNSSEDAETTSFTRVPDDSVKAAWEEAFRAAIKGFEANSFAKVVLAKRKEFELESSLDAYSVLRGMLKDRRSYSFCFWPTESKFFLSRTPECLFRQLGNDIEIDALGGTVPRDHQLVSRAASEIKSIPVVKLDSDKTKREHQLVIDDLLAKLAQLEASDIETAKTTTINLLHVSHLSTALKAKLKVASSKRTLETLHPTAAVCGFPDKPAYSFIAEHEGFNRGWYAGAVGVLEFASSEFIVALRCVLADAQKAYLYAGAGLVAGSDVDAEWLETEAKLASLEKTIVKYGL